MAGLVLAVRVKGSVGMAPDVKKTLETLGLRKAFTAGLYVETPSLVGMLKKASRYITWGRPNKHTLQAIFKKAGLQLDEAYLDMLVKGEKALERSVTVQLRPPSKSFKRSVKRAYRSGGECGERGEEINSLVERMV